MALNFLQKRNKRDNKKKKKKKRGKEKEIGKRKKKKSSIGVKPGSGSGTRLEVSMTLCACWASRAGQAHNAQVAFLSFRRSRRDSGPLLLSGDLDCIHASPTVFAAPYVSWRYPRKKWTFYFRWIYASIYQSYCMFFESLVRIFDLFSPSTISVTFCCCLLFHHYFKESMYGLLICILTTDSPRWAVQSWCYVSRQGYC